MPMYIQGQRIFARTLSGVLAAASVAYAALVLGTGQRWSLLFGLIALGVCAAAIAESARREATTRFSMTFVLTALAVLPAPGGLLVALASAVAGRGRGLAGPHVPGIIGFGSVAAAAAVVQLVAQRSGWVPFGSPASLASLAILLLLFVMVQLFAFSAGMLLGGERYGPTRRPGRTAWRPLLLESLNVPLAWVLAATIVNGEWFQAAAIAAVTLAGATALRQLDAAMGDLRKTNAALASRVTELATLHAIGREIASSLEPKRVFTILERECRKIFMLDYCLIALAEVEGAQLRAVYRRRRGSEAEVEELELSDELAAWVAQDKRALRFDDLEQPLENLPRLREITETQIRSLMIVPLIVEDRVIGMLSVQSRSPYAYDDHQLSVLTTIAQQAAVAIENAKHYQMATVDSLTRFHSRDYFFRRLEEELRRANRYAGRFALLMLDLDGFKELNDRHGHLAGDQYLRAIAGTIRTELRDADLPCRYGGDEFCLLLPETELDGARVIAERIRAAVAEEPVEVEGKVLRTTASIGVAAFPEHPGTNVNGLLRNADQALYLAKKRGRDCVVPFAA